jgi:hypothetical protein
VCAPGDPGKAQRQNERSFIMANLELSVEELKALEETLQQSIGDLDEEVGHTDSHDFKAMLKHKKAVLDHVLEKVRNAAVPD